MQSFAFRRDEFEIRAMRRFRTCGCGLRAFRLSGAGWGFFACASMVVLAMTFPHNDHHDPRNSHEQEIAVLSRMGEPIRCLAFSSDGSMLATIGWDQSRPGAAHTAVCLTGASPVAGIDCLPA